MFGLAARSAHHSVDGQSAEDTDAIVPENGQTTQMPSEFEFRGLRCFQKAANSASWFYLPRSANVRRDGSGAPDVSLVDMGAAAHLLFTAMWGANETDLEALRNEIAVRCGDASTDRITLSFAAVSSLQCEALVGDGSGSFEVNATSATSGFPPYDAVFGLPLRGEQLAFARAALGAHPGFLAIEYSADLRVPVAGSATLTAEAGLLIEWIRSRRDGDDPRRLLDEAVLAGIATVTVEAHDTHTGLLTTTLYEGVLAEAARTLPNWLDRATRGDLRVSVTVEDHVDEPVRAFADIGMIVAGASTKPATGGSHAAD